METRKQKNLMVIAVVLTAAAVIILVVAGFAAGNKDYKPAGWVLKAYGNNLALYSDGRLTEIYTDIMLDNLPEEDSRLLSSGIAFPTRAEAERAAEDYDG